MAFFLTSEERNEMDKAVKDAVAAAKAHVDQQNDADNRPNTYQQA